MKNTYSEHQVVDHKVEITEIDRAFYVFIDGLPLNQAQQQAKFSSAQAAYKAAEAAIAQKRHE